MSPSLRAHASHPHNDRHLFHPGNQSQRTQSQGGFSRRGLTQQVRTQRPRRHRFQARSGTMQRRPVRSRPPHHTTRTLRGTFHGTHTKRRVRQPHAKQGPPTRALYKGGHKQRRRQTSTSLQLQQRLTQACKRRSARTSTQPNRPPQPTLRTKQRSQPTASHTRRTTTPLTTLRLQHQCRPSTQFTKFSAHRCNRVRP